MVYKSETFCGVSMHHLAAMVQQEVQKKFFWDTLLSILELHCERPFQGYPNCSPFMSPDTKHLVPGNAGAKCQHPAPGTSTKHGKWGIPEASFQNSAQECLI